MGNLTGQLVVTEPEAGPVTEPASGSLRSVTWSNAEVTQLLFKEAPGVTVRVKKDNKAVIGNILQSAEVSVGVSEGKIYFDGVSSNLYNLLAGASPVIKSYLELDGKKVWLTTLPPWVDPGEVFAPDVDKLPLFESVTTLEGEATVTYRWP